MIAKYIRAGISVLFCLAMVPGPINAADSGSSCVECHEVLSGRTADPVRLWRNGAHRAAGVSCHDCHGGNPLDMEQSMDHLRGSPEKLSRVEITEICGGCHSSAQKMKLHRTRIDQVDMYLSGRHGAALDAGKMAPTCVSCHGAHGTLSVKDPESRAYPVNVPDLCAGCHGSETLEGYRTGIHGKALLEDLNLRAPSCADCHGAHGTIVASPVETPVICGQCHQNEVRRFNEGPHRNSLEQIGQPGCTGCHDAHRLGPVPLEEVPERIIATCPGCHPDTDRAVIVGQVIAAELEGTLLTVSLSRLWAEEISMRGLDTLQIDLLIREAESWISQAIPAIHAVDLELLKELTGMAKDKVKSAREHSRNLQMELGLRRVGLLFISLLSIIIIVLLALKLRQLEREKTHGRTGGNVS